MSSWLASGSNTTLKVNGFSLSVFSSVSWIEDQPSLNYMYVGKVCRADPHPYSAVARKLDDAEIVVLDFSAVERPHPNHDVDVVAVDFVL